MHRLQRSMGVRIGLGPLGGRAGGGFQRELRVCGWLESPCLGMVVGTRGAGGRTVWGSGPGAAIRGSLL